MVSTTSSLQVPTPMENPDLQAHLAALDAELEEGDITQKGYQKRRTLLFAQFGVNGGPSSTTSSSPSHQSLQQWRYSGVSMYGGSDTPTGAGGTMSSTTMVSPPPGDGSARGSFLQSTTAPPHLRSNSNGSRISRDESLTLPTQGSHNRNISNASNPSMPGQYPFTPQQQRHSQTPPQIEYDHYEEGQQMPTSESRSNTMHDAGNYFSDFTAQAYDPARDSMQLRRADSEYTQQQPMRHRYSAGEGAGFSPTAAVPPPMLNTGDLPPPCATNTLMPLEPRDVPFAVDDPHNHDIPMSKFDNIASVLRHRARTIPKQQAYIVLDNKGKEVAACSWEKLCARAEKVAQVIREKSGLYRGDRVALVYRDVELIDFAVALLGCFIAGVVAVPINNMDDYPKLNFILTSTQAHLALTTDTNLKAFQRELTTQKLTWPKGVEWWKTNEFGSFHAKKNEDVPPLQVPDLAYIEFSRAPTGDLRGVVLSHRTIMHQMGTLSAIINTVPSNNRDTFDKNSRDQTGRPGASGSGGEILVSYLDPRQGIGLIHSVLMAVYGGQTTVWCSQTTTQVAGLYANIITRYKATLCLADYPALKLVAYNYQTDPFATRHFQKKYPVDFSTIKLMMIDALVVDSEFHEILADRWLKPLGNTRAREVVAPMLCLPEHGGMVISMRDWVGGEERMGCPLSLPEEVGETEDGDESPIDPKQNILGNGYSSLLSGSVISENKEKKPPEIMEVLLDREALKTNDVVVVAMREEVEKRGEDESALRVGAFGYPIPDATLAIVDPETSLLCSATQIGEIWVDSPSLSGGFWALPKQTETIFHARPYRFEEGNPHPIPVEPEFLRTGLLGCVIEGQIFVLGLYEDRLRQRVEWVDGEQMEPREEYRYFFVQHLVVTMMRKMQKIYDCSAFDVCVNDEHLPIILLESHAASTAPATQGGAARQLDIALLDSISERCMEVLLAEHQLRVYCVMITAPGSLPRVTKFGRREIGNMLCRRDFDSGTLPCVHVEFGVERAVRNLPIGIDPVNGIWSYHSTQARLDILGQQEKQYSGVDWREVIIDDRTSTPLNNFTCIVDLLQWRVSRQAEELSYCTIDGRAREGKGITWKKLDLKIAAVASQIKNKWKLKAGDHAILIYTHSEDFLYALHACFCLGVIAIPLAPLDSNRLAEDIPAFLHMITDFNVKMVLVNSEVEGLLKGKPLSIHLKQSASVLGVKVPPVHNTAKPPKSSQGCRDLGYTISPDWVAPGSVALVWTYWTPDQRRVSVALGHQSIMGICKVMKETCQMTSSRPVVGCVRSTSGMGFVMSWLMGIFVGE
jgi:acyl-CoA synthetase (AMP-forming)/AMP-acid ligase II